MHELICALVHAETEKKAIQEAYRVFSTHCAIPVQYEDSRLKQERFDAFVIYDRESIKEVLEWKKETASKKKINVLEGTNPDSGEPLFHEVPVKRDEYIRGLYPVRVHHYKHPEIQKRVPVPAVLPAHSSEAKVILEMQMEKLRKVVFRKVDELREYLDGNSNEVIFYRREEPTNRNQRGCSLFEDKVDIMAGLFWHTVVFDHNATPVTSYGQLENVLGGFVEQFLFENNRHVYEKVHQEENKDRLGDDWTQEIATVNKLPLWLVNADSHS